MAAQAISLSRPGPLVFARSESKMVGTEGPLMRTLRDNSPRVVAGMKMLLDITLGLSGDPFMIGYAGFAIAGRLITIAYGSKANQEQVVAEDAATQAAGKKPEKADVLAKIMSPRHYPVESGAAFSVIAEMFGIGFGISEFTKEDKTGYTPLIAGIIAVWSYANILFGKEKADEKTNEKEKSESLVFLSSASHPVGWEWFGKIHQAAKDNPVLTSSLVNVAVTVGMAIGGWVEGKEGWYIGAACIGIAANLLQAFLVRKNEFNIEGARGQAAPTATAQAETIAPQRGMPWGMQAGNL